MLSSAHRVGVFPLLLLLLLAAVFATSRTTAAAAAFQPSSSSSFHPRQRAAGATATATATATSTSTTCLAAAPAAKEGEKGYVPKWKKKETLADEMGSTSPQDVGLVGTIPVIFKQGKETKTTMAIVGQPLSDVASQAGQFIKYGCGKGECGTCECKMNGQWIRPCSTNVPADLAPGEELVLEVKEIKRKSKSSGKFFSVKSFFMGFYNNLLGMVGFVKTRRLARKNWEERKEFEDLIQQKTLEKKRAKAAAAAAAAAEKDAANNKK